MSAPAKSNLLRRSYLLFMKVDRRNKMGTYTLKSIGSANDYMTIVREVEDGYVVRIVRDQDGYNEIKTDYISKSLFESCVRTGYLTKVEDAVEAISA